jgi:hypothetical protein
MFFQLQVGRREDNKDFITPKWVSRAPKKIVLLQSANLVSLTKISFTDKT